MELRQIRHLIAVVEHGSYARAAETVGISQSALTQSIARLEEVLGVRLLDRGRFGAVPTEAGQLLMARGRLIEAEAHMAMQDIDAFKGGTRGDVRLGVGKSLVQWLVPEAIARFVRQRPDVIISAEEGISADLYQRLLKGSLDLVVSGPFGGVTIDPDLVQRPLYDEHEVILVGEGHPLTRLQTVGLADLAGYHWIVTPRGMGRVAHLRRLYAAAGLAPPSRFIRTDSGVLMERLVMRGVGIGVGTSELLAGDTPGLRALNIPALLDVRHVSITRRRRSRPPPLAAAFEALLVKLAAERPEAAS